MRSHLSRLRMLQVFVGLLLLWGCDTATSDVLPSFFREFKLYADEIYTFNSNNDYILRLDPLVNDSIKAEVNVTYSQPLHGRLLPEFDGPGTMGYKPNQNFYGADSLEYTVCLNNDCQTEKIKLIVEQPYDPATCQTQLNGETLETTKNTSKQLRIFLNDVICYSTIGGIAVYKPEKGTFEEIQYAGSYKNTIYVYIPPKDFVGEDSFRYRVYTTRDYTTYQEIVVPVTVR
ncbi:cadherin-like domain-containing protein [Pontibacter vulgaris]|uniref:cadherin-like domain-containing protein n=1 Tax=Pontibacter vulgaris TaxID=2905679 RepID=UPI001FA8131B|nr:cadherin-like domain-containing protein [Pontibacter vulgaris]